MLHELGDDRFGLQIVACVEVIAFVAHGAIEALTLAERPVFGTPVKPWEAAVARYNVTMNRKTRIQPIEPAEATESDGSEHGYDRPSKSQLKRDMLALQVLGVALIELPKEALKRMPMPEKLDDAVRECCHLLRGQHAARAFFKRGHQVVRDAL